MRNRLVSAALGFCLLLAGFAAVQTASGRTRDAASPGPVSITPTPASTPAPTPVAPGAPFALDLVEVAGAFTEPSLIASSGDPYLYVGERDGQVWRFDPLSPITPTLVLSITNLVDTDDFEAGFLGLVFDPGFSSSGYFYVNYTSHFSQTVIARYTMSSTLPVGTGSEQVVATIPQPFSDNNGGGMVFGDDGYLYVALGDGGGGDPFDLAQNPFEIQGKILRLDLNGGGLPPDCGTGAYTIPADNPFAAGGGCGEVWQIGFRNIWGLTLDSLTGDMWIADVGAQTMEEIDFVAAGSPAGSNFGWSCYEGTALGPNYDPGECTDAYIFPTIEYNHGAGRAVTGGYVYRGAQFPFMQGYYFYADYVFGKLWTYDPATGAIFQHFALNAAWSAFGQGSDGALYIADFGSGKIYRIEGWDVSQISLPVVLNGP